MTIWEDAADIISGVFGDLSDETVTYSRGASTLTGLSATFGQSHFEGNDKEGSATTWITEDALIDTADLVLDGSPTKPQKNDRIARTLPSGQIQHYEVHQPSPNVKLYTLSCQDLRMRIHCKRVAN